VSRRTSSGGHAAQVLAHRREPEGLPPGHRDVVEADHAHVAGHAESEDAAGVERAQRDDVVAAHEGGRARRTIAREQVQRRVAAGRERERPAADPRVGQGELGARAELAVAAGARVGRPEHRGDPLMPDRVQRTRQQAGALDVVDRARRVVAVVQDAVEEHEREPAGLQQRGGLCVEVRRGEDCAVDRSVHEMVDVVVSGAQQDRPHAGRLQADLQRVEQLEVEGVVDLLDDDADPARAPGGQAATAIARHVAERAGRLRHPYAGELGHARVASQRARDRGLGDPRGDGDVVARWWSHGPAKRTAAYVCKTRGEGHT
jgi:hypothetical protein